ncbi:MAG: hypothetical protein J6V76_00510 [Bacteroidales bacterium]|nr:hypothetical protein [Bacteroidales bacterium]MBO7141584.1 hypothetical protein [Bacteroidales bacterium]
MIKRILLLTALFVTICTTASAQWFVGGNASVNIQNSTVYANIAPEFGRRFVNGKLSVAISPFASYYKTRGTDPQTTYGGRAYATYDIYDGFYAIGGIQAESYKRYNEEGRIWQISIPVGAGYRRCFGNLCVYAEVTYDLLFDEDSYGENPMIRAGANYSF